MTSLKLIVLFLLFGIRCNAQQNSRYMIDSLFDYKLMDDYVQFVENSKPTSTIQEVNSLIFTPYTQKVLVFGGETPSMWLKFSVDNHQNRDNNFIVEVSNIILDGAEIFLQDKDTIIQVSKVSRRQHVSFRPIPSNKFLFKIHLKAHHQYVVFVKTPPKHERHRVSLFLWDYHKFEESNLKTQIVFFILIGCLLLAVLVSLSLFLFLREKIFWQYGFYILSLVTVILAVSGYIDSYILSIPYLQYDNTYTLIGFFCIGIHLMLSNNYLTIKQLAPYWVLFVGKSMIILSFLLIILHFLPLHHFFVLFPQVYHNLLATAEIYIFINIINGLRKKHKPSIVYFIRFVPYILGAIPFIFEVTILTYLYQLVEALLIASIFEMLFLAIGVGFSYFETLKTQKILLYKVSQSQSQILQAQETERKRLAQDLHDDLGGTLSAIKGKIANETQNPATLNLVEKAIDDLRSISRNLLQPELAKNGLSKAIHQSIERLQNSSPIDFTLITFGNERRMVEERELNIYRIISELLNNIVKHSNATKATIQVIFHEQYLYISVEDNGVGIKTEEKNWGIGLKNVNSRIEFLKAKLLKDSNTNGTTFIIEVSYI